MKLLRGPSISRKLTSLNMLVTGAALLLACLGFLAYDLVTFRDNQIAGRSAQAQIIGANSVSAIVFNDQQSAERTLAALQSSPNLREAGILTPDGHLFARYLRPGIQPLSALPQLPAGMIEAHWYTRDQFLLVRAITLEGKTVGSVYIRASLRQLTQRVERYAMIAGWSGFCACWRRWQCHPSSGERWRSRLRVSPRLPAWFRVTGITPSV